MSVTEVHGALGLDKLKNRTFQIFKVIQIDISDYSTYILYILYYIVCNDSAVSVKSSPGKRYKGGGPGRKHGMAEQHFAEQEVEDSAKIGWRDIFRHFRL